MSRKLQRACWFGLLMVFLTGCGAKQERNLAGNWNYTERVLNQNAGVSMILQPDGKMIRYVRLEIRDQLAALEIHGTWEADPEKRTLTITKTDVYWNQVRTEMPLLLGTESGPYRWEDNSLVWTRETGGQKETLKLNWLGEAPKQT